MRKTFIPLSAIAAFALLCPVPQAHAVAKEIIQLQTQVEQLQQMVQHLQETTDEHMSVLQHMVQQTQTSMTQMSQSMTALQQAVAAENQAGGGKIDQLSGQMQGINDSIDELKTRIAKLDKELQDIQGQMQNVNGSPAGSPAGSPQAGPTPPGSAPDNGPGTAPSGSTAPGEAGGQPAPQAAAQPQAPPLKHLYQSALSDYNGARYDLATSEFGDVLKYYPMDPLAGNAAFYIGEIAYRQGKYADAIKSYDQVLGQFAGGTKAPAAQLHKGEAEFATGKREAGIRDLRSLIRRYPQTPEAAQARSRLNGMGVRITPSKPSAYR